MSDVLPPPVSSSAFTASMLASGAIPLYFPLDETPLDEMIPAIWVPCTACQMITYHGTNIA